MLLLMLISHSHVRLAEWLLLRPPWTSLWSLGLDMCCEGTTSSDVIRRNVNVLDTHTHTHAHTHTHTQARAGTYRDIHRHTSACHTGLPQSCTWYHRERPNLHSSYNLQNGNRLYIYYIIYIIYIYSTYYISRVWASISAVIFKYISDIFQVYE